MTRSCHSLSSAVSTPGNRLVAGTGSSRPSRLASLTAAASTVEESRPPEKLTRQGARWSAGRIASSSASTASAAGSGSDSGGV